jgi:hypothetical protein
MPQIYQSGFGRTTFVSHGGQTGFGYVPRRGHHHITGRPYAQGGTGFFSSLGSALKNALMSNTTAKILKYGVKNIVTPLAQTAIQSAILGANTPAAAPQETTTMKDEPVSTAELVSAVNRAQQMHVEQAQVPSTLPMTAQNMKRNPAAPRIRHRSRIGRRTVDSNTRYSMQNFNPPSSYRSQAPRTSNKQRRRGYFREDNF